MFIKRSPLEVILQTIVTHAALIKVRAPKRRYHEQELLEMTIACLKKVVDGVQLESLTSNHDAVNDEMKLHNKVAKQIGNNAHKLPRWYGNHLWAILDVISFVTTPQHFERKDYLEAMREIITKLEAKV